MSLFETLRTRLRAFSRDQSGTVTVEAVLTLPILFLVIGVTYEFFEVHRYKSARDKASYTIADMISREMAPVDDNYIDNTKTLFDTIVNDNAPTQLRVSIIKFDEDSDKYSIVWSEVRGTGNMTALKTEDVASDHASLPGMADGEELILVEWGADYQPMFDVGFDGGFEVASGIFTSPRFAPQIVWDS
ncbi:pilus assembly protein [Roseovarius sp. SCSIO 43702]|uniref:TadE/TadG family type IV pilus assembly protein n=1 Tax=Roseovarius sp. SCSIO 43702 TaxID=2823043 RepID=UPI001C72F39C|nr:TadE/TadG family type IV pilus assembly protein [Roseovarius sp. SCSIO 43702]QYX58147.1 pilus assembly protein [Roseovarius sp. SCSIO 43702]